VSFLKVLSKLNAQKKARNNKFNTEKYCYNCDVILTIDNWLKGDKRTKRYICQNCKNNRKATWIKNNRAKNAAQQKKAAKILKLLVLSHYCNDKLPACQKCKFTNIKALSIDHINGDGAKHRKEIKTGNFYQWLKKNDYPEGFQVLCMNCQWIKRADNNECKRAA